jgi:hypothetical protein
MRARFGTIQGSPQLRLSPIFESNTYWHSPARELQLCGIARRAKIQSVLRALLPQLTGLFYPELRVRNEYHRAAKAELDSATTGFPESCGIRGRPAKSHSVRSIRR